MTINGKLYSLLLVSFISCSSNHFHDGKYKGTVYDGGSLWNMHTEVLTINGNEIIDEKYSLMDRLAGTSKVSCKQYVDRIEFTENGVTKILTINQDSSLRLNADIVFKKVDENFEIKEKARKPLIKKKGDKLILLDN